MNLRQKTLVVMIMINITVLSLAILGLHGLIDPVLSKEEQNYGQAMTKATLNSFEDEISYINITAEDWANWDLTYRFVKTKDQDYITDNLDLPVLSELKIDFLLFYNNKGELVYGKIMNSSDQESVISNSTDFQNFSNIKMNNSQSASGIVLIGDNPAILVSHPILTTRGEGEPAGTLLMGRFLDSNEMENIFNINRENVTIYSYFNTQLPPDLLEAKENLNQRQDYIKILDGNKIASYSLINGINGTPSVIVRSEVPRVLAEFQNTVFYYIVLILIMGLLNGMVIIYYLDWKILNRLEGMSRQVLKMGSDKDISKRLPDYGDDELGNLGKSINQMLGSIEQSDAQIKISLREKEILLREIHHRTKNNLQIIAALLEMQADEADDPRLNEFFRESQNRIHAMSMVHENLYMSTNLSRIALDSYLKNLVEDLIYSYKELEAKIKLKMDVDPIKINIESTIPCGLIVTEIVSNALKHAFKGFDYGEIYVGAYYEEDYIVLEIKDNGVGIPDDVKLDGSTGLGLQLVETFVEQLEGSISINRDQGTSFTIKFKEIKYRERM